MSCHLDSKHRGTVVFFSIDALGHIHPILSIAKELKARNYRVVVVTVRKLSAASRYEAMGIEFQYCEQELAQGETSGGDTLKNSEQVMEPLLEIFRKGSKFAFGATYSLTGACGRHVINIIEKHNIIEAKLKSLKPDLIVVDYIVGVPCTTTVAPKWVRLYSGYPTILYSAHNDNFVAGLGLARAEMTPEMKKFEIETKSTIREKLSNFFKLNGVPDWPSRIEIAPTSPYLNFYLGPEELGLDKLEPPLNPLPKTWLRLEHTMTDKPDQVASKFKLPDKLTGLPGKLVYFSLGTLVSSDYKLINRLLSFMSKSPNRFIVSKGPRHELIEDNYANIWGDKYVDQNSILPQVDLFITHGGHNSLIEAFYFGVPGLLILPVFADQFDTAQRVQETRFGIRLNPYTCTEQQVLESIDKLLDDHELARKMKDIGSRLRSIEYHKIAVDRIEDLLHN